MRGQLAGEFDRSKVLRDANGRVLGFLPRTGPEALAFILRNADRDTKTGCLLTRLRQDEKGYARINFGGEIRAHRLVFYKGVRPPAGAPHVLHSCDNRHCVELSHLYAGTNIQNIADKVSRDRSGKKLNIAKAKRIKAMLAKGHSQSSIARRFGISPSTVHYIKKGRHWAHVQNATQGAGSVSYSTTESGT